MKKIIQLTKVFLKNYFDNFNMKMGMNLSSKKKIFPIILYLILFIYLVGIVIILSYNLIVILKAIHQETVFIGLILFMILGFTIIQTIFSSINILYFSKDSEYLLPLPIKPYQIITARFNVMLISEYLVISLIGLIPLILYGILTSAGVIYYLIMFLALLLIPILPILLISIIVIIIMNFARLTKNRGRFQLIAYLILLIAIIGLSVATSGMNENISNEEMAHMLLNANSMVDLVKGYFLPLDFLISALTTNSYSIAILEIFKTLILTVVVFVAYLVIAEKFYFHGLVGNLFGGGALKSSKILSEKQYSSKLFKSYIGKEFKILYRNHIFLIQCLLPAIFIPIIMLVVTLPSFNNGNMELTELINQLGNFNINSLLVCSIILGLIQFFSMFIYISITAISRDGNNANFIKYIPVSLYKQYIYKIVLNVIMNIVTIIITLFLAWFIFKLPIITLIVLFIVATIIAIFQSILMIIIDLKRPKLNWDFEYAVVKQNLNLVFPMLLGLLNILVIALIVLLFKNINVYLGLIIIGIIFLIFTIITNNYLYKNQFKLAEKII